MDEIDVIDAFGSRPRWVEGKLKGSRKGWGLTLVVTLAAVMKEGRKEESKAGEVGNLYT